MAILLFAMSSRTGQERFDTAQATLAGITAANARLDAALFPLFFEFRTDLDALTNAGRELRQKTAAYVELAANEQGPQLLVLVDQKLDLVEDFKSEQAVARNSKAIGTEMLVNIWAKTAESGGETARELAGIERAFLDFASQRNHSSAEQLRATIDAEGASPHRLTSLQEWPTLAAHAATLMRYSQLLSDRMSEVYAVPVEAEIARQQVLLQRAYSHASATAARYRLAMLIVVVLLLGFSASKVVEVGRYVGLIKRANEDLERRVEDRTRDLLAANESIQDEMRQRAEIEAQLRLAQKLESIGQLAAGIAHEINTPTQYVNDNVTFLTDAWKGVTKLTNEFNRALLQGDVDSSRSRQIWDATDIAYLSTEVPAALEQATSGLQQISRIVRAMKDFSHPGEEGVRPADINRAIESTVTVAHNEWKYVAELTLDLDPDLPLVPCNVSAINQVILNIVVNAAQALGERLQPGELGHIWVSSGTNARHVEVIIEDDGPGIPEAIRDKVFDQFFTTKQVGKGTGQGLAIAHRVVQKQHGGTLSVTSGRNDRGAKFSIRLPLGTAAEGNAANPGLHKQPLAG